MTTATTATEKRDADIRRAWSAADADWLDAVLAAIEAVARRQPTLTTDDVLAHAPHLDGVAREPRALGPAMLYAAKDGIIAPTDEYERSHRRQSNGRMKRRWTSLVYRSRAPQPERTAGLDVLKAVAG
jgi:hypothetical protein